MQITDYGPQNIDPFKPVPNCGSSTIVVKVEALVARFFKTIGLWFAKNASSLKDQLIDLFPERIAMRLDSRWKFANMILDSKPDIRDNKEFFKASKKTILKAITEIPVQEREEVVRNALLLITSQMWTDHKRNMIKAVSVVPANERDTIIALALQAITEDMDWYLRELIIETLTVVPPQERANVLQHSLELINPQMSGHNRQVVIKAVAEVPSNERDTTLALTLQAINEDMNDDLKKLIVMTVSAVPALKRASVLKDALKMINPQMDGYEITSIIEAVAKIPDEDRNSVLQQALKMFNPQMDGCDRASIIQAVAEIRLEDRDNVLERVLQMINPQLRDRDRSLIIKAVAEIRLEDRNSVLQHALQIINPQMGDQGRASIIEAVAKVPDEDRESVLQHALQIINPQIDDQGRALIIQAVAKVPDENRESVLQRTLQVINPQMSGYNIACIIKELDELDADERANYVPQLRYVGEAYFFQNPAVAAENGINVHQGDRDQRVRAAIELLRQHQGQIPEDRMNQAVEQFKQYLNDSQMSVEHKQLARHALLGPKEANEDFGPLISEINFSILGLVISGKELIGRLWIFASEQTGPDQINAKDSMISALKNSCVMGSRVCDPGKTQRLIIGVLQGRLAGVDIELRKDMQVPINQAMEMFFNVEAHRNIEQLELLTHAAKQFCDENPLVNQDKFLSEIRKYAELQGIKNQSNNFSVI